MFYLDRRRFLNKVFFTGSAFTLNFLFYESFLEDFSSKFLCEDFYLMGTNGKIQIFCDDLEYGKFIIDKSINRVKYLENILTKFSPLSDVGILNNNPFEFNEVSSDTLSILKIGNIISKKTFGYFDMGMGNLLSKFGIDSFVPIVGKVTQFNDMNDDLLIFDNNYLKLNRKNSMIDLGGIGKGFALDECFKILSENGIKHAAIEFGGDVRVMGGMPNNLPWKIFFDKRLYKFLDDKELFFDLFDGSIAVSGGYLKKSFNTSLHHIVNPYSLGSNENYLFIAVLGEKSVVCDSLSTAFFNMDLDMIKKSILKFPNYTFKVYN
jgi:thiamine biosynthesis lipoprotein